MNATSAGKATRAMSLLTLIGQITISTITLPNHARAADANNANVMAVTVTRAQLHRWSETIPASGAIAPREAIEVSARLTGVPIVKLSANVGDHVKRGQTLGRFDARKIIASLHQAEAQSAQAEAVLRQSKVNAERARGLKEIGAISDQDLLQAETQYQIALAGKKSAEATLTTARIAESDTRIVAPASGIISARNAMPGQVPMPGAALFSIIGGGLLEWRAELTAAQMMKTEPGMSVILQLPDGSKASGKVRQSAPSLDPVSRLGIVYIDLDVGSNVKAAMYLKGDIDVGSSSALTLPSEGVLLRDGRSIVYRIVNGAAQRTVVRTGRRQQQWVEILDGLQAGDEVIVRGAGFLTDGEPVRLVQAEELSTPGQHP
ncbi:efflux RND transporter periplasmic adaptor subunit [Mariprofundus erugo]|nr:efflux RND transporter periplasmic adaptor subunit [Mariprofundus erugo]